jgi:ABC-type oligopeptide transport system substrate-binding subunit
LAQGQRVRKAAGLAVDMEFNHNTLLLSGGREFQ